MPRLRAGLLSAVSRTVAALPDVKLDAMPRMADFARILAALDLACPELTGGRALDLYAGQRKRIAGDVVDSDPVAAAVVRIMEDRDGSWQGTAGELLQVITPEHSDKQLPRNARGLVGRLKRIAPALKQVGLLHTPPRDGDKTRTHRLEWTREQPPTPPEPPSITADAPETAFEPDPQPDPTAHATARTAANARAIRPTKSALRS